MLKYGTVLRGKRGETSVCLSLPVLLPYGGVVIVESGVRVFGMLITGGDAITRGGGSTSIFFLDRGVVGDFFKD